MLNETLPNVQLEAGYQSTSIYRSANLTIKINRTEIVHDSDTTNLICEQTGLSYQISLPTIGHAPYLTWTSPLASKAICYKLRKEGKLRSFSNEILAGMILVLYKDLIDLHGQTAYAANKLLATASKDSLMMAVRHASAWESSNRILNRLPRLALNLTNLAGKPCTDLLLNYCECIRSEVDRKDHHTLGFYTPEQESIRVRKPAYQPTKLGPYEVAISKTEQKAIANAHLQAAKKAGRAALAAIQSNLDDKLSNLLTYLFKGRNLILTPAPARQKVANKLEAYTSMTASIAVEAKHLIKILVANYELEADYDPRHLDTPWDDAPNLALHNKPKRSIDEILAAKLAAKRGEQS